MGVVAMLVRRRIRRRVVWLLASILVGVYLWKFCYLLLTNANLPWHLQSGSPRAGVVAVLLSCAAAVVCVLAFAGLARASLPGFVVAVLGAFLLGWLLYPTSCDTHESFLDLPNKTCSCLGTTLAYYPQGVYDGTEVDYCIGLERPTRRSQPPP
jgi:hypothetical protein